MSSPATVLTLASDVLVLGAAVSVSAVGLTSLGRQYKRMLPAPISPTLGVESSADEDDDDDDDDDDVI